MRQTVHKTPLHSTAKACATTSVKVLTHRLCPPGSPSHELQREVNITNLSKTIPLLFAAQSGYMQ